MDLSIATHFAQGGYFSRRMFDDALSKIADSGADGVRDGMSWPAVEERPGVYDFSEIRQSYIGRLADEGVDVMLSVLPSRNPLYDNGNTVYSNTGVAAFADFVVAIAQEFPSVQTISIGNEFNGLNRSFVNGRAASMDVEERVAYYTRIVKAVDEALDRAGLDVDIAGGALHSVATGYVEAMIEAGTFAYIDSLDFHPYGDDPVEIANSLARLNEILDTLPRSQRPDLVVTEFAQPADLTDPLSNANYLAKMVVVLAEAGVKNAAWYALYDEDDTGTPNMGLYDAPDRANDMLDGFRFTADRLEGATVTQLDTGPGIELYDFGNGTMLLWGSAQGVSFSGRNLVFRDASGARIDTPTRLSDAPIFIEGTNISVIPADGPGELFADSFYDYDLSKDPGDPWTYHTIQIENRQETFIDLVVVDGQERMNDIWNPYLGSYGSGPLRVSADVVKPTHRPTVERFTAQSDGAVDIVSSWKIASRSTDGVIVEIRVNGDTILEERITDDTALAIRALELNAGDTVDFIVHDGNESAGDITTRQIRILDADESRSNRSLFSEHLANDIMDGNEGSGTRKVVIEGPDPAPGEPTNKSEPTTTTQQFAEKLVGTGGDDFIRASEGSFGSHIVGRLGDDTLIGRAGDDLLEGGGGQDVLRGRRGDDTLLGNGGRDTLDAGSGADVLDGGRGPDVLTGGTGRDTFVFTTLRGRDTVTDFNPSEGDVLDLTGLGISEDGLNLTQRNGSVILSTRVNGVDREFARVLDSDVGDFNDPGVLLF